MWTSIQVFILQQSNHEITEKAKFQVFMEQKINIEQNFMTSQVEELFMYVHALAVLFLKEFMLHKNTYVI